MTKSVGDNSAGASHNNSRKGGQAVVVALIRTVILYLLLIAGLRLMGKRQVGELEPSELVVSLLIADLAAVPMQDFGIPLLTGVIPIVTLLCLTMILSVLTMKSLTLRTLLCGRSSIVVRNGVPDQREMRRNRYTVDELLEELRIKGYTDLSRIRYAILETNGQLSVLPCPDPGPEPDGLPRVIISDGRLLETALADSGHDRSWLDGQLRQLGCACPGEVFLMTVDESGRVYCALRRTAGEGEK